MIDSKKLIKEYGLTPNKALGQNFLVDESALNAIKQLGASSGKNVLEVGPGLGVLTDALAENAKSVCAVEIDSAMVGLLNKTLSHHENIRVINKDFLRMKQSELRSLFDGNPFIVTANLPYYITSQAAMKLIDSDLPIERLVLMMQQEASAHFVAAPRSKCYTPVSVLSQRHYSVSTKLELAPSSYYPEPAVHSVVLLFERNEAVYDPFFSRVVKSAFLMRRKTLRNNLSQIVPKQFVQAVIEQASIDPSARAEELSVDDFVRLSESCSRFLSDHTNSSENSPITMDEIIP